MTSFFALFETRVALFRPSGAGSLLGGKMPTAQLVARLVRHLAVDDGTETLGTVFAVYVERNDHVFHTNSNSKTSSWKPNRPPRMIGRKLERASPLHLVVIIKLTEYPLSRGK